METPRFKIIEFFLATFLLFKNFRDDFLMVHVIVIDRCAIDCLVFCPIQSNTCCLLFSNLTGNCGVRVQRLLSGGW